MSFEDYFWTNCRPDTNITGVFCHRAEQTLYPAQHHRHPVWVPLQHVRDVPQAESPWSHCVFYFIVVHIVMYICKLFNELLQIMTQGSALMAGDWWFDGPLRQSGSSRRHGVKEMSPSLLGCIRLQIAWQEVPVVRIPLCDISNNDTFKWPGQIGLFMEELWNVFVPMELFFARLNIWKDAELNEAKANIRKIID